MGSGDATGEVSRRQRDSCSATLPCNASVYLRKRTTRLKLVSSSARTLIRMQRDVWWMQVIAQHRNLENFQYSCRKDYRVRAGSPTLAEVIACVQLYTSSCSILCIFSILFLFIKSANNAESASYNPLPPAPNPPASMPRDPSAQPEYYQDHRDTSSAP